MEINSEFIINFENKFLRCFFGYKGYIQIDDISTDKKQAFGPLFTKVWVFQHAHGSELRAADVQSFALFL